MSPRAEPTSQEITWTPLPEMGGKISRGGAVMEDTRSPGISRGTPDRGINAVLYLLTIFPSVSFGALRNEERVTKSIGEEE